jgi:hypothetical protein
MMRIAAVMGLLLLAGCVTEDPGVAAAREAQDDASCRTLSAGKGESAYQQCRQNVIGYRQQVRAENARLQSAARMLQSAGE